jgi:hypothetical protein
MGKNDEPANDPDTQFTFGVRELQQAQSAPRLALQSARPRAANESRGFDPYNTSGSFDRKKHWSRIGRR